MARQFNGTSDYATVALDLSPYSTISVSFWYFYPTNYNNNLHTYLDYGLPNWTFGGFTFHPWGNVLGNNGVFTGFANAAATKTWFDVFPVTPVNDWRHAFLVFNRSAPSTEWWFHGIPKAAVATLHDVAVYGNFANSSVNAFGVAAANFGAGRIAELAIWGGDQRGKPDASPVGTSTNINSLTAGVPPPLAITTQPLIYLPWTGEATEPELSGLKHTPTLFGSTSVSGGPHRTMLEPAGWAS